MSRKGLWLATVLLLTVVGYLLLWHGAVYLESAQRAGITDVIASSEVVVGSLLLWPVVGYGWITPWLTGQSGHIGLWLLVGLQSGGYLALYFLFQRWRSARPDGHGFGVIADK